MISIFSFFRLISESLPTFGRRMAVSSEVRSDPSCRRGSKCLKLQNLKMPQTLAEPLAWNYYISYALSWTPHPLV